MAGKSPLVDLNNPIGTAVRLARLVRRDLDGLAELVERARDRCKAYTIIEQHIDGKPGYREAKRLLEALAKKDG